MQASRRARLPAPLALAVAVAASVGGCRDEPEDSEFARQVIGPAGGIITSVDSVLTLAIPPGALEESVEFFIERTSEPPPVFGQAYLVRPNPELRYDITVAYRQELPEDTSSMAVGGVDILAYEAGHGHWQSLPVLRVDRQAKLVSGLDDGVSIFYALLDDADDADDADEDDAGGADGASSAMDTDTNAAP
jgi:hypothetical protein